MSLGQGSNLGPTARPSRNRVWLEPGYTGRAEKRGITFGSDRQARMVVVTPLSRRLLSLLSTAARPLGWFPPAPMVVGALQVRLRFACVSGSTSPVCGAVSSDCRPYVVPSFRSHHVFHHGPTLR